VVPEGHQPGVVVGGEQTHHNLKGLPNDEDVARLLDQEELLKVHIIVVILVFEVCGARLLINGH
jgi:hypothetical protein